VNYKAGCGPPSFSSNLTNKLVELIILSAVQVLTDASQLAVALSPLRDARAA